MTGAITDLRLSAHHKTGPSGSGKSAVVKVLAKALGYDILEWEQPVPTSWDEHQYQVHSKIIANILLSNIARLWGSGLIYSLHPFCKRLQDIVIMSLSAGMTNMTQTRMEVTLRRLTVLQRISRRIWQSLGKLQARP